MTGDIELSFKPVHDFELKVEKHEKPSADVKVGVKEDVIKVDLPDNNVRGGNILINLEDTLLRQFGKDPATLDDASREEELKKIRPNIEKFNGKLPHEDPNDSDSPITFETWTYEMEKLDPRDPTKTLRDKHGNPVIAAKIDTLKIKVTWRIEVNVNGEKKTIEASQYIKTINPLPSDLGDLKDIRHAKNSALLDVKVLTKLHKKALMGEGYDLKTNDEAQVKRRFLGILSKVKIFDSIIKKSQESHKKSQAKKQEKLIKHLREHNVIVMTHSQGIVSGSHVSTLEPISRDTRHAHDTEIAGLDFRVGHDESYDIEKRELVHLNKDLERTANKADSVYTKWEKTPKKSFKRKLKFWQQDTDIPLAEKYARQVDKATIRSPELDAFSAASKKNFKDSDELVENLGEHNKFRFRQQEETHVKNEFNAIKNQEDQLRLKLLELSKHQTLDNIRALFAKTNTTKKLIDEQIDGFNEALKTFKDATDSKEKTEAKEQLETAYHQLLDLQGDVNKLNDRKKTLELHKKHVEQVGGNEELPLDAVHVEKVIEDAEHSIKEIDKKLDIYRPLLHLDDHGALSEAKKIFSVPSIYP